VLANSNITIRASATQLVDIAVAGTNFNYSTDALAGDTVIRAQGGGRLVIQTGAGSAAAIIDASNNIVFTQNVTPTALTASSAVATNASKNLVSVPNNGTGNNVLTTSPTLVTPNIGAATGTSLILTGAILETSILQFNDVFSNGTIDSTAGSILLGYNMPQTVGQRSTLQVFDNSSDTNILFSVESAGTGSGSNAVIVHTLTASQAVFNDSSKGLVSRPGFSYGLYNTSGSTGIPNNSWTLITNITTVNSGGNNPLSVWSGSNASFRNDSGSKILYTASFSSRPVGTGIANWAARIRQAGTNVAQTEVSAGRNEVCISATGYLDPSQTLDFECNQYTGFGQNAEGVVIGITTYPIL
jgi:hypothetical protein